MDQIIAFVQRLNSDLIVLGHYPLPTGGFWWSGFEASVIGGRVKCCIFVAVNAADEPASVPK